MKSTKKRIEKAIISMAELMFKEDKYEQMILNETLDECIRSIVFEMFICDIGLRDCSYEKERDYNVIYNCADELDKNGELHFIA